MDSDLDRLERRIHRTYWNDGLLDLFAGLSVLGIGISWVAEAVIVGAVLPGLLVTLWSPLRARFTEPRMGHVELSDQRHRQQHALMRLMVIAGVLSFLLGIGMYLATRAGVAPGPTLVKMMPPMLVAMGAVATAEGLDLRRFFAYGALLMVGSVLVGVCPLNPGWGFIPGGLAATGWGAVLAVRFVRRFRLEPGQEPRQEQGRA